uniref:Solute carrier family 5 member 7 n=1 Tax=Tetraodon nigroviridis TaxID=99883 RepID=H3CW83_TETNG
MAVNVPALLAVVVFYLAILAIGFWAFRKAKKVEKTIGGSKSEVTIVGGRNINVPVGVLTLTATWVGGSYIMGTAEVVYSPNGGLAWAIGPFAYTLCFICGGLFFAKPMRSGRYVTMMDPFQQRYGNFCTTLLLVPALIGDILWVASTLAALGGTMTLVLGLSSTISIIISASVCICYTLLGGLYAVTYTDVIQLVFNFVSLYICVPFVVLSPAVTGASQSGRSNQSSTWVGELKLEDSGKWIDEFLLLALGGLAHQALYQRILSSASTAQAQATCYAAILPLLIMGIPSVAIAATAASADWNMTDYGLPPPFERGEAVNILPLALQYLAPTWLSVLCIGAIAAAAMSSMDSALLSSASMFTQNMYKRTWRKQASERELKWVVRGSLLAVGLAGMGVAFGDKSVFSLWILSGDLLYCVIFPQLLCVLHVSFTNGYGAIGGYAVALLLRLLSGESALGIPPLILYPWAREKDGVVTQYFPFRTFAMICSLICIIGLSKLVEFLFRRRIIPKPWDVLQA